MRQTLHKKRIRARFRKALDTYDAHAVVQRAMATRLVEYICAHTQVDGAEIYEIGCGTGFLTAALSRAGEWARYTANDLVPACEKRIHAIDPRISFVAGDAEDATLFAERATLIVSTATFQWLNDLPAFLRMICARVKPGGVLAFATFIEGTAQEMAATADVSLTYPTREEIEELCAKCGEICVSEVEAHVQTFATPRDLLMHFSRTGANALSVRPWTRRDIEAFSARYTTLYAGPPQLTYCVYYGVVRVKGEAATPQAKVEVEVEGKS